MRGKSEEGERRESSRTVRKHTTQGHTVTYTKFSETRVNANAASAMKNSAAACSI